jgi:hypothetical protein
MTEYYVMRAMSTNLIALFGLSMASFKFVNAITSLRY